MSKPIPFTVTNALKMCWGLTLRFSHESQQQDLGKDYFIKIMENINLIPNTEKPFLAEFVVALAKTTRNMGLIRVASIRHLERQAREYSDSKELLNSISELSFSKESIPLKIVSFLGFGSVSLLNLNPFKETLEGLKTAGDILKDTRGTIDARQINEIVQRIFEFSQFTASAEQIILFALFGSIGIFIGSILFKLYSRYHLYHKEKKLKENQEKYWKDHYIGKMENTLYSFYVDIKDLFERYYAYDLNNATTADPVMSSWKADPRAYIRSNILPEVDIDWDIWLPSQKESPSQ